MSLLATSLNRLDLVPPSLSQNQSPNENEKLSPNLENAYANVLSLYQVSGVMSLCLSPTNWYFPLEVNVAASTLRGGPRTDGLRHLGQWSADF